ncbi:amidase [Lysinibacillus fusiformis]
MQEMVRPILLISVIIFVVTIVSILGVSFGKADAMPMQERMTWVWDTAMLIEDEAGVLNFLEEKYIFKVYLQINYDITYSTYRSFIEKATARGIKVYALDGASSWVSAKGYKELDQFMDWLKSYNSKATTSERFVGIHLDVEPYLNTGWERNQAKTIQAYQAILIKAKEEAHQLQVPLEADMPFWFDEITYSNQYGTGTLAEWVIDEVESVTIMAYRDTAEEIIKIIENEIAYGNKVNKSIVVGVETGSSSEGQNITFYEEGEDFMNKQLVLIQHHYANSESYKGIAIHHMGSWMTMLP